MRDLLNIEYKVTGLHYQCTWKGKQRTIRNGQINTNITRMLSTEPRRFLAIQEIIMRASPTLMVTMVRTPGDLSM